jgi:hypothetical protein
VRERPNWWFNSSIIQPPGWMIARGLNACYWWNWND